MRYHSYLMMFTFCQLIQVKGNTFLMQSQVVAFLIGLFIGFNTKRLVANRIKSANQLKVEAMFAF